MSPDRTAQSLHPVTSPGNSNRKSQPVQHKDHRPTALPGAARESWAGANSHLALFFVRLLRQGRYELLLIKKKSWASPLKGSGCSGLAIRSVPPAG